MTQYNSLNVKLSNSQLNKLKSSIKNENDVVLRISLNMVSNSNDNTNFPHELNSIKKMIQSGGFLGNLLGKLAGPLMKVAMPLAKNVLAPLGLSTVMSAIDGSIKKKMKKNNLNNFI